jgi:hypothetical protein
MLNNRSTVPSHPRNHEAASLIRFMMTLLSRLFLVENNAFRSLNEFRSAPLLANQECDRITDAQLFAIVQSFSL